MPVPHCFDRCSFVLIFKLGSLSPPSLFFFKIVLAEISRMLWFRTEILKATDLGLNLLWTHIYLEEV